MRKEGTKNDIEKEKKRVQRAESKRSHNNKGKQQEITRAKDEREQGKERGQQGR